MQAKFIGDPNDDFSGPKVLNCRGVDFPKGRWVRDIPEELEAKLRGHSHFEISDADEVLPDAVDAVTVEPAPIRGAEAFDRDGDGAVGGSLSKAALRAELDRLGVDYSPQLGAPKLAALLEAKKFELGD